MKVYGFGIAGAGLISRFHAQAIKSLPNARLVAVASRTEKRARPVAEEFASDCEPSYEKLVSRPDIDVLTVCTPSGAHAEVAILAASAGKHVMVEKPLETTLERADLIRDACRKAGVKLAVVFQSRFSHASSLLRKAIEEGRLGRITLADAYVKWWRSQEYYDTGVWKGTRSLDGGGSLMNQSIHAIDLLQWFAGPVKAVSAFSGLLAHDRIEVEDTAVAALEFESGALGVVEGTTAAYPGFLKRIEISGEKGTVIMEEEDILTWKFREERPEDDRVRKEFASRKSSGGGAAEPGAISVEGHIKQFADFIEAIEEDRPPLVDGVEGRKAVEIVLAIYQSAKTGKRVTLPLRTKKRGSKIL